MGGGKRTVLQGKNLGSLFYELPGKVASNKKHIQTITEFQQAVVTNSCEIQESYCV